MNTHDKQKFGRKGDDVLFDHVPKTQWFIDYLQGILSKCGKENESKLLFVTIDACRNYQDQINRSSTSINQSQNIHYIQKISNVYTIVRYSVPDKSKAANYNSYTKKFLDEMDSRKAKYFINGMFKDVNLVKGNDLYVDRSFGPDGPLGGGKVDLLREFKLIKEFTKYISDNQ